MTRALDFERDMLATVGASVGKITRLLTRLQADRRERSHAPVRLLHMRTDGLPEWPSSCPMTVGSAGWQSSPSHSMLWCSTC